MCSLAITRYATATAALDERMARTAGAPDAPDDRSRAAALRRAQLTGRRRDASYQRLSRRRGARWFVGVRCRTRRCARHAARRSTSIDQGELAAAESRDRRSRSCGIAGGFQDHYAAAFGGALLLSFSRLRAAWSAPDLPDATADALARRGVLLYTGESRISAQTIAAVRDGYVAGDPRTYRARWRA